MEGAFIITQVARKEQQLSPLQWNPGSARNLSSTKSRGRSIFSLLFCCFPIQKIGQFPEGSKHTILPKESGTVSMSNLPQVLQCQYSWPIDNADFTVPLQIEGMTQQVYVFKRPYVDKFLQRMGELFECVLFTASIAKYADPVTDLLDKWGVFRARLFRESCVFHQGSYVKDLSRLGRDLNKIIIIDNSPASYIFHPNNAVPVTSWFDDLSDTELLRLIPAFEGLSQAENVYTGLGRLKPS
ncbi:carboxy-terminal domain RNA polymerase II polypeptide A small phosphatase 2-like isoform X1 [Mustelus asterias]